MPLGPIFTPAPVNWSHPLNRGRVLWLYGIPPLAGGSQWYDLCNRSNGALSNAPAWATTGRGDSGLRLVGASVQQVNLGSPPSLQLQFPLTIAAWVRPTLAKDYNAVLAYAVSFSNATTAYSLVITNSGQLYADTNGTNNPISNGYVSANVWQRIAVTIQPVASGTTFYRNGGNATSASGTPGTPTYAGKTLQIGTYSSGGSSPLYNGHFDGQLADVSIWSRALSASEILADYDLSRRNYPGVLNRIPFESGYSVLPFTAATGWGPLLGGQRNRRVLAG